ncbi:hypothetical protein HMPREF3218_0202147 [Prevotella bivia]|nr:hypothetical protein HMPREF3218_0202147 [Prevotella bivia]
MRSKGNPFVLRATKLETYYHRKFFKTLLKLGVERRRFEN